MRLSAFRRLRRSVRATAGRASGLYKTFPAIRLVLIEWDGSGHEDIEEQGLLLLRVEKLLIGARTWGPSFTTFEPPS